MIIIHGENITESRKKLDELLLNQKNIQRIEGKSLKATDIPLLFQSSELFAEEKTIVIENCKSLSKQALEVLVGNVPSPQTKLIFWQDGNYDARNIKKFPDAKVYSFPLPKYFFIFLDNLLPGKATYVHTQYELLLHSFVPEQVLFAMTKRIRNLLVIRSGSSSAVDEVAKMSDWQRRKLESQARGWTHTQLKDFYKSLFHTEMGLKTSNLPINLTTHLDNIILTKLQ